MATDPASFALPIRTVTAVPTQGPSGFLKLSTQIRNRIYALLIPRQPVNVQSTLRFTDTGIPYIQLSHPTVSATSRLIREESLDVYYSTSTFRIQLDGSATPNTYDVIAAFFEAIGQRACQQLTRVTIRIDSWGKCRLVDLLPITRIFARRSLAIPKVSCLFIDYAFKYTYSSWEADEWATELAQDMAEIGRIMGARGVYDPDDQAIKAAVWFWRPAVNRRDEKCGNARLWEQMEPTLVPSMENWIAPLPEERAWWT